MTWVNNNYAMEGIVHDRDGEGHLDFWGIRWEKQGDFNQPVAFPLAGASREAMLEYRFPELHVDFLLHRMDPVLLERDRFFIGCDVSPCGFEMYWRLRGMEQAMTDIALDPDLAAAMLDRCARFAAGSPPAPVTSFPWTGSGAGTTLPDSSP